MASFDYTTYLSPFTWRYGSSAMRAIWSETNKRKLWRSIWVALARAQHAEGLVTQEELDNLLAHQDAIDIEKAHKIEQEIHHDLMAEIKTFAEQAKIGGGKLHLGATSMDIEDNADALRCKESLILIEKKLQNLLNIFAEKIAAYKAFSCMAYTHLQPAEPTTLGYRFCLYTQDLLLDLQLLHFTQQQLKGKGLKGAVGTSASYVHLLNTEKAKKLEATVMEELGIDAVMVASQTAPRKLESFIGSVLSSIAQSLHKFAFDVRLMQSPGFAEWQEPFGKKQVGSSAMPFKRNPIKSEQICSLGRLVLQQVKTLDENTAHMGLERTLDDSANRRVVLPELFLAIDNMLDTAIKVLSGLVINEKQIRKNLEKFGPFAATEVVMMEGVKRGGDRQELHEAIRENALQAYEAMQNTDTNPLEKLLANDKRITRYIKIDELKDMLDPKHHIGLAEEKCDELLQEIKKYLPQ